MTFRITFTNPDALENRIKEALDFEHFVKTEYDVDAPPDPDFYKKYTETLELCKKWFQYNEIIVIEIDTSARTCIVVEQ